MGDKAPTRIELQLAIDAENSPQADSTSSEIVVLIANEPGLWVDLVLPIDQARRWAADLYVAVSIAYREETGDPRALTNDELAALPQEN